jgi:hypothetical protein
VASDLRCDRRDDLYKLKGNSECNEQLQPGFESSMTAVKAIQEGGAAFALAVARIATEPGVMAEFTARDFSLDPPLEFR